MDNRRQFVEMLMAENRTLNAFAYSIARMHEDAEDIVQKAVGVMWEKYDEFEQGTNFGAWSRSILYRVAMNHMRSKKRGPIACDPSTLDRLSDAYDEMDEHLRAHKLLDALAGCVARLPEKQRRMLNLRYENRELSENIARMFKISAQAVDAALYRTRKWLESCIRGSVAPEEVEI